MYLDAIVGEQSQHMFEKIYKKNRKIMFFVSNSILKNEAEAEDVVHTSFLRLAENFERYEKKSLEELCSLCIIIAKNISIDLYRKKKKISDVEVERLVLISDECIFQPDEYVEQEEQKRYLHELIHKIPESYRLILEMKYYQGLENKEIAQLLNIKIRTVEQRLYRAKERLKQVLNENKRCS
jgi:RNA polymerase sigma-70 factor (ECF subfamily)